MINDAVCIPSWWHDAITGVDQQFENTKEVIFMLIFYSIVKKFLYTFVKNDRKRVTVECVHRKDKICKWRLHAS